MDIREAIMERKLRDELLAEHEKIKLAQARMKSLRATGMDKLQELIGEAKYIGGSWSMWMHKLLDKVEGWG